MKDSNFFPDNPPTTPRPHKPGNYAPEKPPYWTYFGIPMKPEQGFHKPGVQRPQEGINALSDPDWKDPAFIQWFFQPRPKEIESFDGKLNRCWFHGSHAQRVPFCFSLDRE
jgi:hypothetical protein